MRETTEQAGAVCCSQLRANPWIDLGQDVNKARRALLNMVRDMEASQRKLRETQDELAETNQTLEDRILDRTAEIRRLLDEKESFIRQLGHDLRTPLTPLMALLPMVAERTSDMQAREIVQLCVLNVQYMSELVEKTLLLTRLGHADDQLLLESVNLGQLLGRCVRTLATEFEASQVALTVDVPDVLTVTTEMVSLRQIIENILTNALKYTEGGGSVHVEARSAGEQLLLVFRDTGVGMTAEQCLRATAEFYKADPSRHDRSSVGLGLTISDRLARRLGGRLDIHSPGLGEGTTVTLALPVDGFGKRKDQPEAGLERDDD